MSGPALGGLVAYYAVGYVVLPAAIALAAVKESGGSATMALLWAGLAISISAPVAYRATGAVHVPPLGVLNLAVGPATVLVVATLTASAGMRLVDGDS